MPVLYAELQIAGRQVACDQVSYSFAQATDEKGRPSSVVRTGFLKVVISGVAVGWSIWEEIKVNPYRRESGHVIFFEQEGVTTTRYTFYDAALVELKFLYDGTGTAGKQPAVGIELHFSAATIEVHGIRVENYSLIPWPTPPATSFKALTKPADPLPSAHLAAGPGLAMAALKVGEEIAKRVPPQVVIPFAARVITLLPGMLLSPANSADEPANKREWEMYHRNHPNPIPPPPPPDTVRLAQLEHALTAQTLTAQEEAELIILLAKVKGIFVNQLSDLTPAQKAMMGPLNSKPTKPYKNKKKLLGNGPSKRKSKRTEYLGRTPGKASATGKGVVTRMESEGKIQPDSVGQKQVLGPDGKWHSIEKTDMGHRHDAVNWWNAEGRKHGSKSPEVRKWMLDPDNYELEPSSINRSRGAKLKDRYLPPLK